MPRATWNGAVLAQSDETVVVEGNHYFPPETINREHFVASDKRTTCPWKGEASYFTLRVDGEENADAAWTYVDPKERATQLKDHVAFWRGVNIEE